MRTTRTAVILLGLIAVGALAGCSSATSTPSTLVTASAVDEAARQYVLASLGDRADVQDGIWIEESIDDLLPNREFEINGAKAEPLAEGIVVGTVTAVEQGRGYMIEGDDAVEGIEIPFEDPRSLWRVIVLTVKTDTRLGKVDAKSIRVGVVIDGDMDVVRARDGYLSLGRVALVLNAPGGFDFDPAVFSIRRGGTLLGVISKAGTISFPALGVENSDFVGTTDTVRELVTESTAAPEVIGVETTGGVVTRDDE